MFNFNTLLTTNLFSALEQFEVLTFRGPELGLNLKLISYFLPKELFNNLSMSLFMLFFVLFNLCDLKKFIPSFFLNDIYSVGENNALHLSFFNLNSKIDNNNFKTNIITDFGNDLTLEASFIIYSLTNFVYYQILENLVYFKAIFLNYSLALFIFLLSCNLFGMVPYSLTITSYLILTLNLSGMSFFANLIIALRIHKLKFFKFFVPNGVSGLLVILMVVIELISYVARLFSMAIRLFANMLSGHALIKILSGLVFLSFSDIYLFGIVNIFFNLILLSVTALEVIVAALQSYVFVVLSVVYTNESIILH